MQIQINGKTIKETDFNGNTERLLEEIIYKFLNDDSTVMMARLEVVYEMLVGYTKSITKNVFTTPFNFAEVKTDRDKLELVIEQYKFTKYLLSGAKESYESYLDQLEQYEVFSKDKAIMTLIDYKLVRFGNEIFKEMGIEIVDRIDKGFIVKDNSKYIN